MSFKDKKNILKIFEAVNKESKTVKKDYGSGLLGEHIIVASYKTMPIDKLVAMRELINKIIQEKRILLKLTNKNDNATAPGSDKSND